jgi:hypothetical protein
MSIIEAQKNKSQNTKCRKPSHFIPLYIASPFKIYTAALKQVENSTLFSSMRIKHSGHQA